MKLTKIFGLHAVQAALEYSPEKIHSAWIDGSRQDRRLQTIHEQLRQLNIVCHKADKKQLDRLSDGNNHQGAIIEIDMPRERSEDALQQDLTALAGDPLLLILDHVQDPHNLGACLRTADAAGVDGVIITKDQSVGFTPTVCKVASGAAETMPLYQVTNLARTMRWLKSQNIWLMGAAGEATQSAFQADLKGPLALVIGAEGKGLRRLTREQCDLLIKLPMLGQVQSLNLSVASGVLLYEALRQRTLTD